MNHTRSRRFDDQHQESNSPRKRSRSSLTHEEVTDLNLKGISKMLMGRNDEAERCFAQALHQLGNHAFSFGTTYSLRSNGMESSTFLSNKVNGASYRGCSHDACVQAQSHEFVQTICQRQEYDEGMYTYTEALPLEECHSESVRSATLLYNIAQTHVHRGAHDEAKKLFEVAMLRLRAVNAGKDETVALVRINHNMGYCLYRVGKTNDALFFYKEARTLSLETKQEAHHIAAANLAISLILCIHGDLDGSEDCLALSQSALSVYQLKYGESKEVATILNNIGRIHFSRGNYESALVAFENALLIRRRYLGKNSIDVAVTVCNAGKTYHHMGNLDKAMECYTAFVEVAQHQLKSHHLDIAIVYRYMAEIHHERGRRERAKELYEKAIIILRNGLSPHHLELSVTLNRLGNLHYEMHNLDTALRYFTEGLSVEIIILDACHPHRLVTLMNIALIHRQQRNFGAALQTYAEIRSLQIKQYGPNSIQVAETLGNMGLMGCQLNEYASAFELCQTALRIQRDHYQTDDHLDIATTLNSLGMILYNQGVYYLAKTCFTDSLRIRSKLLGPHHRDVAILWYNLATTYLQLGEDDIAIKLYKETLRIERLELGEKHHNVILTLQHLGMVYLDQGELDEAIDYLTKALEAERSTGHNTVALGKLLNLIGNVHLRKGNVDQMMQCYVEALRHYRDEGLQDVESLVIAGFNFYGLSKVHPPCAATA